jgi:hypothetical protein
MDLTTSVYLWSAITIVGAALLPIAVVVWSIYRYGSPPDADRSGGENDTGSV